MTHTRRIFVLLDAGGARDSVEPERSGLLFAEPTMPSRGEAVRRAASNDWDPAAASASAHSVAGSMMSA